MIHTYFTLCALAKEWDSVLTGSTILDCYSQTADELTLVFEKDSTFVVRVGVHSRHRYLFRADRHGKPNRNTTTLLAGSIGQQVEAVYCDNNDRVLVFSLTGDQLLSVLHYGNVGSVALSSGGIIADGFGFLRTKTGSPLPKSRPAANIRDAAELSGLLDKEPDTKAVARKCFVSFSEIMIDELEYRFRERLDVEAEGNQSELLFDVARELEAESGRPQPVIIRESNPILSLIEMRHLEHHATTEFPTIDAAVREFHLREFSVRRFEVEYARLSEPLTRLSEKLGRSIANLQKQSLNDQRADTIEKWGHLLMTRGDLSTRGQERLTMDDLFGQGTVEIPLNPEKTIRENAERHYQKANKIRKARELSADRLKSMREEKSQIDMVLQELSAVEDLRQLKLFRSAKIDLLAEVLPDRDGKSTAAQFRSFEVDGYTILVGKNARQNDELTFARASPHDFWLHARGYAGSHVLLVAESRTKKPTKRAIEAAASIAAHFSKARTSSLAPVIVTRKKYVRKVRRGSPGQVIVTNEEVLLVEPGLPE